MKEDKQPGVLFLAYTTPQADENFKKIMAKKGIGIRELKIYDVSFPVEKKKYDEQVNYFKQFITDLSFRLWKTKNPIFNFIKKKILARAGYKEIEMDLYKKPMMRDTTHNLLGLNLSPIAREYRLSYKDACENEIEKQNYERLTTFESNGFIEEHEQLMKNIKNFIKKRNKKRCLQK